MIPVPMKAAGWFRIYGVNSNSSIRIYRDDSNLELPEPYRKSWWLDAHLLIGERTSGGGNLQIFRKGSSTYISKIKDLKQLGIIE